MERKKVADTLPAHKRLLEDKSRDPSSRIRGTEEKRGLHHPSNPVKYAPNKEKDDGKALRENSRKPRPLTAVEQMLQEDVAAKGPTRKYIMPKEKTPEFYKRFGLDPSKWQTTLQGGLTFAMYPNNNPSVPISSPSRTYLVGNRDNHDGEKSPTGWTKGLSKASFHHYEPLSAAFTENLDGTISRNKAYSTVDTILAPTRYNLKRLDQELTGNIERVYKKQMGLCDHITTEANRKCVDIYKRLLYKIRWADPPMPLMQQGLINDYIVHMLGPPDAYGRRTKFRGENMMRAGFHKHVASKGEKEYTEMLAMINRIRSLIVYNDGQVQALKSNLTTKQSKMIVQKASTLRWKMEANVGRRDRFWTSWFFAMRGMPAELHRHLAARKKESLRLHLEQFGGGLAGEEGWKQKLARDDAWKRGDTLNDADERDPDFGLTALHYGSKQSNIDVVKILLAHGANPNIRAPDGRTALHFAAAYSTREICLELLGAEADIDAVDEYGCKAIHLAEQNENRATYITLEKWSHLVPTMFASVHSTVSFYPTGNDGDSIASVDDNTVMSQEGSSLNGAGGDGTRFDFATYMQIPDEYKPMDEKRIERMSRPLRAIAYRLKVPQWVLQNLPDADAPLGSASADSIADVGEVQGWNNRSGKPATEDLKDMDPLTEIRLCSKIAEGCFAEGFVPEGIQALRRRWKVSKQVLSSNATSKAAQDGDRIRTSKPAVFTLHACIENGTQLAEALITHRQEGFAATILAETFLLTGHSSGQGVSEPYGRKASLSSASAAGTGGSVHSFRDRVSEKYDGLRKENSYASTNSVHRASINNSAGAEDCVTTHSLSITSQYLEREANLKASHISAALGNTMSNKSVSADDRMEPSVAVALLARRCEVLLCIWDLLLNDRKETSRTAPFPMPKMPPQAVLRATQQVQSQYMATAPEAAHVDRLIVPTSHENNNTRGLFTFGNLDALAADGSAQDPSTGGFYDGKGKLNSRKPSEQPFSAVVVSQKIDGTNYQNYGDAITAKQVHSGNQQAYNYSSTYKEYVGRYLDHQAQYVAELRKDLTEHPTEYEPQVVPRSQEIAGADKDADIEEMHVDTELHAVESVVEDDYNHRILVDNQGRPLTATGASEVFAGKGGNSVSQTPASVTFGSSVAFDDGQVSATKGFAEDSSAWYSGNFNLSPGQAYMDRMTAETSPDAKSAMTPQLDDSMYIKARPKTMAAMQSQDSFVSYGYDGEDYQLYQRILGVASETRICIENAINITLQTTSHLLVEPYVLVPLLEILAECYERENNYEDALACLVRAETVTRRTIGSDTIEGITITTNVLRLLLKCETKEGQLEAVHKADELTRLVDRMSQRVQAEEAAELKKKQREKDLGKNFIINPDGTIVLNPDRPSLMEQRQEKMRRALAGDDDESTVSTMPPEKMDANALFRAAVELVSLSKLLQSGFEKMSTYDVETDHAKFLKEREHPSYYSVNVSTTGSMRPNPRHKKVVEARREKQEQVEKAAHKDQSFHPKKYVVTGRMAPVADTSQTLSVATGTEVKGFGDPDVDAEIAEEIDGGLSKVINKYGQPIQNKTKKTNPDQFSTKSAALAPHEHISNVKSDISKQKKRVALDDGSFVLIAPKPNRKGESLYDAKDNSKNDIATQLATASINAGRYLQRKRYLQVNPVPILERRKVFTDIVPAEPVEVVSEDVSSKYYKQLQHRALVLDFKHAKPLLATDKSASDPTTASLTASDPALRLSISLNNSINNSLLIQSNADGTQRNPNLLFSASERTDLVVPRVFEKSRTLSSEGIIANIEMLAQSPTTAVQQVCEAEYIEEMKYKEALLAERQALQQEVQLSPARSPKKDKQRTKDGRTPRPWVLSAAEVPSVEQKEEPAVSSVTHTDAEPSLAGKGVEIESINSPYITKSINLRANAILEYESKYGAVAEARRAEQQEEAQRRLQQRQKEEQAKAVQEFAQRYDQNMNAVRIHPLAETHRLNQQGEADPSQAVLHQERTLMRNMSGIQSLLKSHPALEGLLPTPMAGVRGTTNVVTASASLSKVRQFAMQDPDLDHLAMLNTQSIAAERLEESKMITAAVNADAAKYVGAILTTGHSLVSIPHVYRSLDVDGDAAKPDSLTASSGGDSGGAVARSPAGPTSRVSKKAIKENKSMLRFRQGEWQYQSHQSEADVVDELNATDLRSIQQSLATISDERARNEPIKWSL